MASESDSTKPAIDNVEPLVDFVIGPDGKRLISPSAAELIARADAAAKKQ